jgi:hypothetical protein
MKLMFYALALYVGYRIAVENRRETTGSTGLLAPPSSDDALSPPKTGAM